MDKKILLYIIAGILILGLLILMLFPGIIYAAKDLGSSEGSKCEPSAGYTEQEWAEHMSHHPNIYADCFK